MWTPINKANKQNKNRVRDTENRLTAVRGQGAWAVGEKGEGITQKNPKTHRHRQRYGDPQRETG